MSAANAALFREPQVRGAYLAARGFSVQGRRSGGLKDPVVVDLAAGQVLLRTYRDPARWLGDWWTTPHEMQTVIDYFGRGGPAFGEGRNIGKGILQATLAVRWDWDGNDAGHLGLVTAVRLTTPLKAFYGEGDVAPNDAQTHTLKPVAIFVGGRQRGVRQVFIPSARTYSASFRIAERDGHSDSDLVRMARQYDQGPAPFER
ncbi:hypothetical protein ACO2Q3_12455 [Caulobacter sp. KR2-114]|uniref:hypothetical protein n=1 Tax=Caulobacter sp. KR2-114 TaxID=3400912 RepID=UPI003C08694A